MATYYQSLLEHGEKLKNSDYIALAIAIAIPVIQGFTAANLAHADEWYKKLKRPWFTPPDWVFPVMWTTLYILMGIASWRIWRNGGFEMQSLALGLYILQLVLNFLWSPIFFRFHLIGWALFEIILLWLAVAACLVVFYPVDAIASYLFIPYILWVSIATTINAWIWIQNPSIKID